MDPRFRSRLLGLLPVLLFLLFGLHQAEAQSLNPSPPTSPVKLIFIHHSTGENWLSDYNGGLGLALRDNNYFASDTNYGWGPADVDTPDGTIGDHTDIGHWYNWFSGPNRAGYLSALYAENEQRSDYSRLGANPGGENQIIMFKSCFPNSNLRGSINDPIPAISANPLRGRDSGWDDHTISNAKGIYISLLDYFATRPDKLFVLIVSPPLVPNETSTETGANARVLSNWLVNDWLKNYTQKNVFVFDFFNILTSNGGSTTTNDFGRADGNHHRFQNGAIQHIQTVSNDRSSYGSDAWDSHPTQAGNQKATGEFVPLLNIAYNCWKGTGACPGSSPLPPSELSLSRGRIKATVEWRSQYSGQTGMGYALPQKDEFGYFYFSDPNNPEVFVKCLDFGSGKAIILIGGVTDFYYKVTFKNSRGETLVFEKKSGSLEGFANNNGLSF